MKIFVFGSLEPTDTEAHIARAFERLGHDVTILEEDRTSRQQLIQAVNDVAPDLFLAAKCRFSETAGEFDAQAGQKVAKLMQDLRGVAGQTAIWVFDALLPEFSSERWQWAQVVAPAVDVFACTDGTAAARLPKAMWLPQGSPDDADDSAEWPTEFEGDAVFIGLAYRERHELMDKLRARLGSRFRVVPDRQSSEKEVRSKELTKLVRSYRLCICPPTPTWPGYWSNRAVTLARHGGLLAMNTVSGMDRDGWRASTNYLAMPHDVDGYVGKVVETLELTDRGQMRSIQRAGYELACTLTYERRCQDLLAHLAAKQPLVLRNAPVTEISQVTVDESGYPGIDEPDTEIEAD